MKLRDIFFYPIGQGSIDNSKSWKDEFPFLNCLTWICTKIKCESFAVTWMGMKRYTLTWSVNKFATYTKYMDSKTIYTHNIDENTYLYNYGYYFVGINFV
jgi:hypothetical protein